MTYEEAIKLGYRDIEGYEGHYMVDTKGNVFSLKRKKIMTPCKSNNGYMQVHLSIDGVMKSHKIHRLVAKTFIPNPYNLPQVNHKDEDKTNNCVENLEWCTQSYNMNYNDGQKRRASSRDYEEISKKRSEVQSKEVTQYDFDGRIVAIWRNAYVAEEHGYNRTMINQCCLGNKKSHKGYVWKYTNNMEKQIPKKVEYGIDGSWGTEKEQPVCPVCDYFITRTHFIGEGKKVTYCDHCGQAIDWGE